MMLRIFLAKVLNTIGEILASTSQVAGRVAAKLLFFARWRLATPEWFDQRLTILNPKNWSNDLHPVIYSNVLEVIPLGGKVLDLCSGDGFAPFYYYSRRASEIVCVDYDHHAHLHAQRLHKKANITYVNASVLDHEFPNEYFDVVVIRGAIEHFSRDNQQKIFRLAINSLKAGGYFCGDTPANRKQTALLESHEYEWANEEQMRMELSNVFDKVSTKTYASVEPVDQKTIRETLIWRCQK